MAMVYPIFTPLVFNTAHPLLSAATPYLERALLLGILIGAFPFAQFFGAPLIGQFSDKFGRRRAFFFTISGVALGYTFTSISVLEDSYVGLLLSRLFTGFFAGNLTLCLAAIADMSPDDASRSKNFGHIGAVGGLSFILAIAFGGILSNPSLSRYFNPSFPFWITAALSYINLAFMIVLFRETHLPSRDNITNPLKGLHNIVLGIKNKDLRVIYAVNFLFILVWVASMQFFPSLLLLDFKFQVGGMTLSLIGIGIVWALTNLWVNRALSKWFYSGKTLMYSLLAFSLLSVFLIFSRHAASFLPLFFLATCFAALCWTNGFATVSLKAREGIQGSILGISQAFNSIAAAFGPLIGGLIFGINMHAIYLFGAVVAATAFLLLLLTKEYRHLSNI